MYSSMTTICLLPGIAASLLPFHRDFRSSCAIFRRRRKPQKRRPDGFTTVYSCEPSASCAARRRPRKPQKGARMGSPGSSLARLPSSIPAPTKTAKKAPGRVLPDPTLRGFRRRFRRPAVKLQKRRPGGFSKIQPCEASVVDSGARRKTAKKAPGRVLPDPALRGFRRRFCTASIHRGQLSEPCEARRVCPNGCEKGVRKRQETQQVDRKNPTGRREYRTRPGAGSTEPDRAPGVQEGAGRLLRDGG